MDQEARRDHSVLNVPAELARLLGYPRCRWASRAASKMGPSTPEFNEEHDVERLQPGGLDGEEVTDEDLILVMPQEAAPGAATLRSFRRWRHAPPFEHVLDGRAPDG